MTTRKHRAKLVSAEELLAGDRDFLKQAVKDALQEVLEGEMTELLGAAPGERTEGRNGYRAGYYGRSLVTRIGKLELRVPRDRSGEFSTALFERYPAGHFTLRRLAHRRRHTQMLKWVHRRMLKYPRRGSAARWRFKCISASVLS